MVSSWCVEWIVGRRKKRTFCPGEETREEGRVEAAEDYGKDINLERKTEIIGKFHDKLKELESIIPKESFSKQMKKNKTIKLRSCV